MPPRTPVCDPRVFVASRWTDAIWACVEGAVTIMLRIVDDHMEDSARPKVALLFVSLVAWVVDFACSLELLLCAEEETPNKVALFVLKSVGKVVLGPGDNLLAWLRARPRQEPEPEPMPEEPEPVPIIPRAWNHELGMKRLEGIHQRRGFKSDPA